MLKPVNYATFLWIYVTLLFIKILNFVSLIFITKNIQNEKDNSFYSNFNFNV